MIRESYYSLARKMHPDRFRSGPLQDLLENVESFFTYVTDAYNTLIDPDRRAEYDRQLAEAGAERTEQTDSAWLARQNLLRGKELAARNKYSEAAGFMENALKQDENNPEILTHLGKLLTLNPRRRKEGEDYIIRAGELDPSATDSYLALAEFYIRTERFAEAEEQCRRTLKWEPDNGEAQRILAELQKGGNKEGLFRGLFGN
jgi:curved DNA-binding protein CbpA